MRQARQRGYEVIGEFRPDQVLPYAGPDARRRGFICNDGQSRLVKMTSLRYQTFKKSLRCKCCGIEGSVFLLELPKDMDVPHFNLYAEREGELVQMTKDHMSPKSKGGKDIIGNMQTMCCRCNELKGNQGGKLKRLREIQDGVQTVYTVIRRGGDALDQFATSDRGIAEIVRKHMLVDHDWTEEELSIQVSTQLKRVEVGFPHGSIQFTIKPIRRV